MVKTSELIPSRPISAPWSAPRSVQTATAIRMHPSRPVEAVSTAITADSAAIEPTDRSNSPAMIVTARPSAASPIIGKPWSTEKTLAWPRKVGVIAEITIQVMTSTKSGRT